jgi:hypothetical protein
MVVKPQLVWAAIAFALLSQPVPAAPAASTGNVRLADDVVPAPFGYEPVTTRYVVAEATPLYVSPYIFPGTVNSTNLPRGAAVEVLAKAKDFDWILVGRNGGGIGYVPIERLTPAK